jgi:hypothetical protein
VSGLWDTPWHTHEKCDNKNSLELDSGLCCFAYQYHNDIDIHFLHTHTHARTHTHINWCKANYTVKQQIFSLTLYIKKNIFTIPTILFICTFKFGPSGMWHSVVCSETMFFSQSHGECGQRRIYVVYLVIALATQHCTPQNYWIMMSHNLKTWEGCGQH